MSKAREGERRVPLKKTGPIKRGRRGLAAQLNTKKAKKIKRKVKRTIKAIPKITASNLKKQIKVLEKKLRTLKKPNKLKASVNLLGGLLPKNKR